MPSTLVPGSKAGIITSTNGQRHIPASVRPDGSTRKEIKIRPGYKPPEDVEVYKNRTAEAWKTRGVGAGVPGAATVEHDDVKSSRNKNAKRREARKRAKAASEDDRANTNGEAASQEDELKLAQPLESCDQTKDPEAETWSQEGKDTEPHVDSDAEREKQARNLKKKLRQARELSEKKNKGESLLPEQFAKVIKINELIRQLDSLGFTAEGERKEALS
ncbi:MAG: hypothetical protein Q9183_001419 [Haloplaca sp. 2 TL-2023]